MTTYEAARAALLDAEVELMQQRERVAQLRRALPPGPPAGDWTLTDAHGEYTLDQLVGERPLLLYHFMYGAAQTSPCPSCSMWTDGWNAVAGHLAENIDLALVAAAPYDEWAAVAADRGWDRLRLLSSAGSTFKLDVGGEDADGHQMPFLSVWERAEDGWVRLSWSGGAHLRDEHWRGVDLLSPVWHFLDLTRPGRGDWMPSLG